MAQCALVNQGNLKSHPSLPPSVASANGFLIFLVSANMCGVSAGSLSLSLCWRSLAPHDYQCCVICFRDRLLSGTFLERDQVDSRHRQSPGCRSHTSQLNECTGVQQHLWDSQMRKRREKVLGFFLFGCLATRHKKKRIKQYPDIQRKGQSSQ